MNKQLGGLARQ